MPKTSLPCAALAAALLAACSGGQETPNPPCVPSAEVCDGKDNDCNGQVDEGLGVLTCGTGICRVTVPACAGGVPGTCTPGTPATESCNGLDDDCDGEVDEGCDCVPPATQSCYTGPVETFDVGACTTGIQTCLANGTWGACTGEVLPAAETCNGVDDDCDGQVDDGLGETTCGVGVCQRVVAACTDGAPTTCTPGAPTGAETCNGLDDDCDGEVDEGNPGGGVACDTHLQGVCAAGTTACTGGQLVCNANVQASTEVCDGVDNDCDGTIDNGVLTTWYRDADGDGYGSASTTIQACAQPAGYVANATDCNDASSGIHPGATELCNGLDDNCNGQIDEGNPGGGVSCPTGRLGVCAAGTTLCTGGALTCVQSVQASTEICDGLDNDCDGAVDEGNPGGGVSCNTGGLGVCGAGTMTCSGGILSCVQLVQASAEVCDGKDNDCDGMIDQGNPGGGASCNTGKPGVCAAGTTFCANGVVTCVQSVQGSTEVCDGLDNDCDGAVDEGVTLTFYQDQDGDGFGNPSVSVQACAPPAGYVPVGFDCNDTDVSVRPGAPELCGNARDDNCDGQIDEAGCI